MKPTIALALSLTTLAAGACAELDPATATSTADLVPAKSACVGCTVTGLEVDAAAYPAGTFLDFVPTATTTGSAHVLLARQGDPHATANGDGDGTVIWDIKEVGFGGGLAAYDAAGRLRCTFASGQLRAATGTLIYTVASGAVIPARTSTARYRQVGDDLVDARGTVVATGAPGQGALAPVMLAELAAVLDGACGATP
ncbi:MAG: hypothetical protein JNK64_34305 [Myxococcales bacterium]|nr:hypothetical protein [Myxococcales bacterium]